MSFELFFTSDIFIWVILPVLIFFARILDVTIGTIRIIFVSRGVKLMAAFLGFFEVLIWLFAVGQIMQNLTNIACYIAFAGGFASGTFVGMLIEERIAMGTVIIRIVTKRDATELIEFLRSEEYGVTSIEAQGNKGEVHVIYIIIKRKKLKKVVEIIKRFNPRAFYTIEDLRYVSEEALPIKKTLQKRDYMSLLRMLRKGK